MSFGAVLSAPMLSGTLKLEGFLSNSALFGGFLTSFLLLIFLCSDIPRMLLLILICFFVVLGIAYVIASRPENFASTIFLVKTTVRDTCEFFYKYAVLPVAIVTGGNLLCRF